VDATPQIGISQAQSLPVLFSFAAAAGTKDVKGFEKELTKQIDGSNASGQKSTGVPHKKLEKDDVAPNPGGRLAGELPFVVPPITPALNPMQVNAVPAAPVNVEKAAGVTGIENVSSAAAVVMDDVFAVTEGAAANRLATQKPDSKLEAVPSGDVTGAVETTGSMQKMQAADAKEPDQIDRTKGNRPYSVKTRKEMDSVPTGVTMPPEASSGTDSTQVAAKAEGNATRKAIQPRSSGGSHEHKEEAITAERRQSQSLTRNATTDLPEQAQPSASADVVTQLIPPVPIVMDGSAVNAADETIKTSSAEPVVPIQLKENSAKPVPSIGSQKSVKDQKEGADEPKRAEAPEGSAPLRGAAEQGHQQPEQATTRTNTGKSQDVMQVAHSTASAPSAPADKGHSHPGQLHQTGQTSTPELPTPISTPSDVVHAVRMFERDGQAEMHIGVRSETLGTIDVKATIHDGNVGVSIGVERHEIRSALVSELPGLENTLRERDLRLGEVQFHEMGSALASEYGKGQQQRQAQEFSRPFASAFYKDAKVNSQSNDLPIEMVTTISRGGISVHV
jgi:flagellar hook-length control protein FliK